ncbi:MAG: heme-binding protein [Cyanobium sp. LacPavin_0818_WC50_MAG_67_9]|nr:heme-binding protein [Cyanobium sp. LacPavin_0818_WC50_MAG_67_9]
MRHQPHLELADCRVMAAASHLAADQHQACVSIAVVDAGGHLLLLERRDGSSPASAEAAIAKARMAALNGKPTATLEASINGERPALLQLAGLFGQPAAAMAGGLPLLLENSCLGAIGVSGMTPDVDSAIAAAGLTALSS